MVMWQTRHVWAEASFNFCGKIIFETLPPGYLPWENTWLGTSWLWIPYSFWTFVSLTDFRCMFTLLVSWVSACFHSFDIFLELFPINSLAFSVVVIHKGIFLQFNASRYLPAPFPSRGPVERYKRIASLPSVLLRSMGILPLHALSTEVKGCSFYMGDCFILLLVLSCS